MATTTQYETAQISELTRDGGWAPLRRHFDVRAFGINAWTSAEAGETLIGEHDEIRSGHEVLVYNLACAEARLGETEAAFEHLREAVADRESLAELARTDEDLASLRGDARFEEIVGAATTPG